MHCAEWSAIMKYVQTDRTEIVEEVVRTTSTRSCKNHSSKPFLPFLPVSPNIKLRIAFRVYNSDISTTVCSASYAFACFFAKSARHYMKRKIDINCCSWHSSSRAPRCSEHRATRCCGSIRQTFHRSPLIQVTMRHPRDKYGLWDLLDTLSVLKWILRYYLDCSLLQCARRWFS